MSEQRARPKRTFRDAYAPEDYTIIEVGVYLHHDTGKSLLVSLDMRTKIFVRKVFATFTPLTIDPSRGFITLPKWYAIQQRLYFPLPRIIVRAKE